MDNLVERGPNQCPGVKRVAFRDRRADWSKIDDQKREAVEARGLMYAKKDGRPDIAGRQMQDFR
jgi:hypothetical protein